MDTSLYEKSEDWIKRYVEDIERNLGKVDFILIAFNSSILYELELNGIPYVVVVPDNINGTEEEKEIRKEEWFNRIKLRDNSFITIDFDKWLRLLESSYDIFLSKTFLDIIECLEYILLNPKQYLSDVIDELYIKYNSV